jgi:hypothetical protein
MALIKNLKYKEYKNVFKINLKKNQIKIFLIISFLNITKWIKRKKRYIYYLTAKFKNKEDKYMRKK